MVVEAEIRDCRVSNYCRDGSRSRGKRLSSNQITAEMAVEAEVRDCLV